jgi:hypothetical protein
MTARKFSVCTGFLAAALVAVPRSALASGGGSGGGGSGGGGGGGGETADVALKVLDAAAPPGGTIQMQVSLTEGKPIIIDKVRAGMPVPSILGPVQGLVLPGSPDAAGAAVLGPNGFSVRVTSPSGTLGSGLDAPPILAVTVAVPVSTTLGATAALSITPDSFLSGPTGLPYSQTAKSGTFTARNVLCVTNVVPGGGLLPAGSTSSIMGVGFQSGAKVTIDGVNIASTKFVSSTRIDVVNATASQFDGLKVSVTNPDSSRVIYYSYLRATSLGESAVPLLAATEPIYPAVALSSAVFPAAAPNASSVVGLALQNPSASTSLVTVQLRSASTLIASVVLTMPPRTELNREASELFSGVVPGPDAVISISASVPVQMLGLLGDLSAQTVTPVLPTVSSF